MKVNAREALAEFIGQRLIEVTQNDPEEFQETGKMYIMLMFENASLLQITMDPKDFSVQDADDAN